MDGLRGARAGGHANPQYRARQAAASIGNERRRGLEAPGAQARPGQAEWARV